MSLILFEDLTSKTRFFNSKTYSISKYYYIYTKNRY